MIHLKLGAILFSAGLLAGLPREAKADDISTVAWIKCQPIKNLSSHQTNEKPFGAEIREACEALHELTPDIYAEREPIYYPPKPPRCPRAEVEIAEKTYQACRRCTLVKNKSGKSCSKCHLALNKIITSCQPKALECLLKSGVSPDSLDHEFFYLLMRSSYEDCLPCIQVLLKANASIDLQNPNGFNALMVTAFMGFHESLVYLLENNASTGLFNKEGCSAISYAATEGHWDCVKTLRSYGASCGTLRNLYKLLSPTKFHTIPLCVSESQPFDILRLVLVFIPALTLPCQIKWHR